MWCSLARLYHRTASARERTWIHSGVDYSLYVGKPSEGSAMCIPSALARGRTWIHSVVDCLLYVGKPSESWVMDIPQCSKQRWLEWRDMWCSLARLYRRTAIARERIRIHSFVDCSLYAGKPFESWVMDVP